MPRLCKFQLPTLRMGTERAGVEGGGGLHVIHQVQVQAVMVGTISVLMEGMETHGVRAQVKKCEV